SLLLTKPLRQFARPSITAHGALLLTACCRIAPRIACMPITRDEVAHLARLSRIALSDAELDHLAPQLDQIITAVAQVQEVAAAQRAGLDNRVPRRRAGTVPDPGRSPRPGARRRGAAVQGPADPGGGVDAMELTRMTAAELSAALASREVSATEVTQAHLDR